MLHFVAITVGTIGIYQQTSIQKNLDQHLMSGLNYDGIPDNLRNTSFPFPYNNFEYFINLITKKNIGIVKMEVMRNEEPNPDFLLKIRRVCDKKNNFNF